MSNAEKTLVTVATYNEIENLPRLAAEIFSYVPDVDLLVIDDNSPDGTGSWCERQSQLDTRVHCLRRPGKLGLGTAIVAGMRYGIEHGYLHVLNMDADFSHHPRHLPALIQGMTAAPNGPSDPSGRHDGHAPVDVTIGSRYVSGGGVEGWPVKRKLMSWGVNAYARTLLGLSVKDTSGSYRCYRTEALKKLNFDEIQSRGYSFQEEILWRLKRVGASFRETPITFADRTHGSSKINSQEAWGALRIITSLGWKNWIR